MGWLKRAWLEVFPRYVRMCDVPVGAVFRFAPQRGAAELVLLASGMEEGELIDLQIRVQVNERVFDMKVDALQGVWRVG